MLGLLFTYLMTGAGSIMALVSPFKGFLVYVVFAILMPGLGCWTWSVPLGNYSKILAIFLLLGWLLHGAGDWRFGRAGVILAVLIAYLISNVLAATNALVPEIAWDMVESQAKIILVFAVGLTLIRSVEELRQLAWVILVSHGYVAYEANLDYFSGFNRLHEYGFGPLDNNSIAISFVTCTGLGIFLCLGAKQLWHKAIAAACIGFMVHAILFSFSRGGMLGLIVVVGLSFLLIPKRPVHVLTLLGGALLSLAFAGQEVSQRFSSTFAEDGERDISAQSRLDMWEICIREAGQNPMLGLGPRHFHVHAHEFGLAVGKEAHSTWLQLAVEIGIPGAVFLTLFFSLAVVNMWLIVRTSSSVPDPFLRDLARMVIAAIVGYMFTAQFVTLHGIEAPYYIVLLGAGVLKLIVNPDLLTRQESTERCAEAQPI